MTVAGTDVSRLASTAAPSSSKQTLSVVTVPSLRFRLNSMMIRFPSTGTSVVPCAGVTVRTLSFGGEDDEPPLLDPRPVKCTRAAGVYGQYYDR